MKKKIGVIAMCAVMLVTVIGCASTNSSAKSLSGSGGSVNKEIPEGRELFVVAYDFAKDPKSWKEARISKMDVADNKYVVKGYVVQKNTIGYIRQSYDVIIQSNGKNVIVNVENMSTVASDANGKILGTAKSTSNPKSTMDKLAGLIQTDLQGRLAKWSDSEYEAKLNDCVTDLFFLSGLNESSTSLYYDTFIEKFGVIGRTSNCAMLVSGVDKSTRPEYKYRIGGLSLGNTVDSVPVMLVYFSNDDKIISAKEGDAYKINAKILSAGLNKFDNYITLGD